MKGHRFDFSARIDEMRALKNGANDALLNVWVGKVFDTPKLLDDEALNALSSLASHPYLPSYGFSRAILPAQVVSDPTAAQLAFDLGFSFKNLDLKGRSTARSLALSLGAPAPVHELLSRSGVPVPTSADAANSLRLVIDCLHVNSLEYLRDTTPSVLAQVLTYRQAQEVLVKKIQKSWYDQSVALNRFLDVWEGEGGSLEDIIAPLRTKSREWLDVYDQNRVARRSLRLDKVLPAAAPDPPGHRRPRF